MQRPNHRTGRGRQADNSRRRTNHGRGSAGRAATNGFGRFRAGHGRRRIRTEAGRRSDDRTARGRQAHDRTSRRTSGPGATRRHRHDSDRR